MPVREHFILQDNAAIELIRAVESTFCLFAAAGTYHPLNIAPGKPATEIGIMAPKPDVSQPVPGEIAHDAVLFPISTALQHPAVVENVNLFHQAPAPGKGPQFPVADCRITDVLLIGPIFNRLYI